MTKEEYKNLIAFHPGYYLRDIIDELGMTQDEFAKRLGTSGKTVSELLNGQCSLSNDLALKISAMLGISVETLLNLQAAYDEKIIEIAHEKSLDEQTEVFRNIDFSYFVKNKLIDNIKDTKERIKALCSYLHVSDLRILKKPDLLANFRTTVSDVTEKNIINANVWLQVALNIGRGQTVSEFDAKKLRSFIAEIRSMTVKTPDEFCPRLKEIFNECGVAFVFIPALKNCGVNGVVKWFDGKVVLALNDRYVYADQFWFSLFHEIKHVFQKKITKVLVNSENALFELSDVLEQDADSYAIDTLLPPTDYNNFVKLHGKYVSKADVIDFAREQKVHPGIVVGRLQHDGIIEHASMNNLKEKCSFGDVVY